MNHKHIQTPYCKHKPLTVWYFNHSPGPKPTDRVEKQTRVGWWSKGVTLFGINQGSSAAASLDYFPPPSHPPHHHHHHHYLHRYHHHPSHVRWLIQTGYRLHNKFTTNSTFTSWRECIMQLFISQFVIEYIYCKWEITLQSWILHQSNTSVSPSATPKLLVLFNSFSPTGKNEHKHLGYYIQDHVIWTCPSTNWCQYEQP